MSDQIGIWRYHNIGQNGFWQWVRFCAASQAEHWLDYHKLHDAQHIHKASAKRPRKAPVAQTTENT